MPGIPASAAQIVTRGHLGGGETFAFGQWFQTIGGMTQAILDNLWSTYTTAMTNTFKPVFQACIAPDCGVDQYVAYGYTGGTTAAYTTVGGPAYVGTNASKGLPLQTALVLTLQTGRPGRSYRGRLYLPYLSKTLASYQAQPADIDVIVNAYRDVLSAVKDATGTGGFNPATPAVMSRHVSALTPIIAVKADSKTDVQRRRAKSEAILYSKVSNLT